MKDLIKTVESDLNSLTGKKHLIDISSDCIEFYTKENPMVLFRVWVKENDFTILVRLTEDIFNGIDIKDYNMSKKIYIFMFDNFLKQREIIKNIFAI